MKIFVAVLLAVLSTSATVFAAGMEITPFRTINQSPLVRIFGIPSETEAEVTTSGKISTSITQDIANNFATNTGGGESISMDGESWRWVMSARYGFGEKFEAGVEIPLIVQGGGIWDGFIVDWHKTFGLPQGGRDIAPRDRILYSYTKDGIRKLNMSRSGTGVGDITLTGGMKLYDLQQTDSHDTLAIRTSLKLPTGDSSMLMGSGSTDLSLYLCGSMTNFTEFGSIAVYGSAGGMALTKGEVLGSQQNNAAGFGTLGIGWGPAKWISFKLQINGNTPLYHGSSLNEISNGSLMLVSGGALKLPGDYHLDIAVSEDIAVNTAPDVALHFGLSRKF
jgi:hypothetical protein